MNENDLDRADAELLQDLHEGLDESGRRAGAWLACGPGCSECCIGPFPITRLDVRRLRRCLSDLTREDPARARRILDRGLRAARAFADGYPGDAVCGRLSGDDDTLDRFFERHASLPCPVLDPATGRCELYAARPVSCRTYGPPLRFVGEDAPPCALCFKEAPTAIVERCRFEPDPLGLEEAILSKMCVSPEDDWETLIAFAVIFPIEQKPADPGRWPSTPSGGAGTAPRMATGKAHGKGPLGAPPRAPGPHGSR